MVYPERDISVERIGRRFFLHPHDTAGCNDYLLEGTYSYDEVMKLNALTTYNAGFGFCSELEPVAFIGISFNNNNLNFRLIYIPNSKAIKEISVFVFEF